MPSSNNSIFEFADKFSISSPFGNWLALGKKELTIKYNSSVFLESEYHVNLTINSKNLNSTKALLSLFEKEVLIDEPIKSIKLKLNSDMSNYTLIFDKKLLEKLSDTIFEGDFEFFVNINCDGLEAETQLFKLPKNTKKISKTEPEKKDNKNDKDNTKKKDYNVCPIDSKNRSHFVLHCTAGNMSLESIKKLTNFDSKSRTRSKAHVYIMKDGSTLQIWSFSEKNVWATKTESKNKLKGQMFHVEINYGSPDVPSKEQYDTLANLYIDASSIEKCWPIIVPHIEIDRGLANGHSDPTDFDYNYFYKVLKEKGVPIDIIPKFDHERYWGDGTYKTPWGTDKNSWPPILKGNPHK